MAETPSENQSGTIAIGAKAFVFIVFTVLGLSFFATTGFFIYEFWEDELWVILGVYYSHLFVFFTTFGIIALYAFYLPSTVFVDLYWRHIKHGKIRFITGALVMMALAVVLSNQLTKGDLPTIWDLNPSALAQDDALVKKCTKDCNRFSVKQAIAQVKSISSSRIGLSKFMRQCTYDKLLPEPPKRREVKYCFANGKMQNAENCCASQKILGAALINMAKDPRNLSTTGQIHRLLLPLKVFFLIILLVIGGMLVFWSWHGELQEHYSNYIVNLEKGILSGVIAMLFWPMTNHAFLQSATVLFGYNYTSDSFFAQSAPIFSLLFGLWAILIVLFFMQHREQRQVELFFKGIGVVASGFAMLKYDLMIDYFVRYFGSGVDWIALYVMSFVFVLVLFPLLLRKKSPPRKKIESENIFRKNK